MTFSARTGSQHKKTFLIDKLVSIFFSFSCSQNAHINLLYVFVNLFGKYFHYINILWTVCCEYLLSNIYINSVLVSHLSDTVSLLSYFASYKDISHLKYCENQTQHTFCYYLSFCLNSLWQMKVNLDYFRAQINICGIFPLAQAAQVIAIFWPRFSLQTQVSTTFFTWSFTLLCEVPMDCEGVFTVHSRNGFIAAKHFYQILWDLSV